jgi:YgiT-type zinc finger domain-containing protein
MKCFFCKSELEHKKAVFTIELESCIIVIKDVPTDICEKCGQKSYSDDVAARIEEITEQSRDTLTEIVVVHFSAVYV